jgi:hypothetical protein
MAVRLSALRTGRALFLERKIFWYSFLLEAEFRNRVNLRIVVLLGGLGKLKKTKSVTSSGLESATFLLVA